MTHLEIQLFILTKELGSYLPYATPKWALPLFFHWLQKEKCLLNYLNNFDKKFFIAVTWRFLDPIELIESAFEWRRTDEGEDFWIELSSKWKRHYNIQLRLLKS